MEESSLCTMAAFAWTTCRGTRASRCLHTLWVSSVARKGERLGELHPLNTSALAKTNNSGQDGNFTGQTNDIKVSGVRLVEQPQGTWLNFAEKTHDYS